MPSSAVQEGEMPDFNNNLMEDSIIQPIPTSMLSDYVQSHAIIQVYEIIIPRIHTFSHARDYFKACRRCSYYYNQQLIDRSFITMVK